MSAMRSLSFADIVQGRQSSVRITDDGMIFAVDLAIVVTGKSRDDAGMAIRRLPEEIFPSDKMTDRKFPGKGNARTRLVSFENAIELIMVLPGKVAKETRTQFADIIRRYMAGDATLVHEIQANAESSSPIAELARASLEGDKELRLAHKRKLEELELEERTAALNERLAAIERTKKEVQAMHTDTMAKTAALYTSLCPNQEIDERGRLLLKDCVLNSIANGRLLTNDAGEAGTRFITISTVASELGHRFDSATLIKIGRDVKREYENMHCEEPPKHEQMVGGGVRYVCSYQERDRPLVESVIKRYSGVAKKA